MSPPETEAVYEELSLDSELSEGTTKEPSDVVGQLDEAMNAKVNSEAVVVSEGPVTLDDSSTEELFFDEPTCEATGSISSGMNLMDKGKRKLTPEEEAKQEERRPKMKKGRSDTSLDGEITRLSGLLQEKSYDVDEILLSSVPRMAEELDCLQQQEQAAAAANVVVVLTKKQKEAAYRYRMKVILLEYGFHSRQLGPMKNSTMEMHVREIKAKVARVESTDRRSSTEATRASAGVGGTSTAEAVTSTEDQLESTEAEMASAGAEQVSTKATAFTGEETTPDTTDDDEKEREQEPPQKR
ncbi:hypothetical protein R6Q57_011608 [Mikania cordata]